MLLRELGYARAARTGEVPAGPLGLEPCGPQLAEEIAALDRLCFGRHSDPASAAGRAWNGERLWQTYRREASRAKKYASEPPAAGQPLPDLYPAP